MAVILSTGEMGKWRSPGISRSQHDKGCRELYHMYSTRSWCTNMTNTMIRYYVIWYLVIIHTFRLHWADFWVKALRRKVLSRRQPVSIFAIAPGWSSVDFHGYRFSLFSDTKLLSWQYQMQPVVKKSSIRRLFVPELLSNTKSKHDIFTENVLRW